jgi:hypothetical protein
MGAALRARFAFLALILASFCGETRAGLYYSGETIAELPSQWRGFLIDHRALRMIGAKPAAGRQAGPLRVKYEEAATQLEKTARQRRLKPEESADLGALYVRLGEPAKAIAVLRQAQANFPGHFRVAANLGTAWQMQGDLVQAAANLREAVRLAPGKLQRAEEYQLKLVELRQRHPAGNQELDDLFGVHFVGDNGQFVPGRISATERKRLTAEAPAIAQQLALWLPADGRLLWQLAELANGYGDVRMAAAMMDGCVTEFAMTSPTLRRHRQLLRAAVDELAANTTAGQHGEQHLGGMKPNSRRPLAAAAGTENLPPIRAEGINALPWAVLAETTVDRRVNPTFPKYLTELNGKQVSLSGYIQPLSEDVDLASFLLIEAPVGCWYCEMPEISGIVLVELDQGKTVTYTRSLVQVVGELYLNANDPENFLYTIRKARAKPAD